MNQHKYNQVDLTHPTRDSTSRISRKTEEWNLLYILKRRCYLDVITKEWKKNVIFLFRIAPKKKKNWKRRTIALPKSKACCRVASATREVAVLVEWSLHVVAFAAHRSGFSYWNEHVSRRYLIEDVYIHNESSDREREGERAREKERGGVRALVRLEEWGRLAIYL